MPEVYNLLMILTAWSFPCSSNLLEIVHLNSDSAMAFGVRQGRRVGQGMPHVDFEDSLERSCQSWRDKELALFCKLLLRE